MLSSLYLEGARSVSTTLHIKLLIRRYATEEIPSLNKTSMLYAERSLKTWGGRLREDGVTPMLSQLKVGTADHPLAPINSSLYRR
jgi:hypothetical protein